MLERYYIAGAATIFLALASVNFISPSGSADAPQPETETPYVVENYIGTVTKVTDGDTIEVSIEGWPKPYNPVSVRVYGIDTPESSMAHALCKKEAKLGVIAKAWVKEILPIGSKVKIQWQGIKEKYGRLLAHVTLPNGKDFAEEQIRTGNARPYFGETKSNWCK